MTTSRSEADVAGVAGVPGEGDVTIDASALSFDDALAELQRTVAALEEGGLPLERTLELYERGVALHDRCARLLADAEIRIRRLVEGAGGRPELSEEPTESADAG